MDSATEVGQIFENALNHPYQRYYVQMPPQTGQIVDPRSNLGLAAAAQGGTVWCCQATIVF